MFAFFDPLLSRTPSIIEVHHPGSWIRAVSNNKAYPGEQSLGLSLDLGYHPTRTLPAGRLVGKVMVSDYRLARAQVPTLRQRLVKLSGLVEESVRRLVVRFPQAYPWPELWFWLQVRLV